MDERAMGSPADTRGRLEQLEAERREVLEALGLKDLRLVVPLVRSMEEQLNDLYRDLDADAEEVAP